MREPSLSEALLPEVLRQLDALVAFDTRNPPRDPAQCEALCDYIVSQLDGFTHQRVDLGEGCQLLWSTRGVARVLMNAHVDTVPAAAGWLADPLRLRVESDRAIGLGACDIKGAAACMIAAARLTSGPASLLFTTDEEAGSSRCVRAFLDGSACGPLPSFDGALIAEPTRGLAVAAHRGIVTYTGEFDGVAGHASQARALHDSANHAAARWAVAALEVAALSERESGELPGLRFNLGRIEGGTKPNMIADHALVRWGIRPGPAHSPLDAASALCALAASEAGARWTRGFYGPTLPAPSEDGAAGAARVASAKALAIQLGLTLGAPVDFWTEAALFSQAGHTALVCGPGDIAQAHAPEEWVALDQLASTAATYARLMQR